MQKYNFSNPKSVVEVNPKAAGVATKPDVRQFICLCRGFGQNNHAPRKTYVIVASTPSQAARIAIERYRKETANPKDTTHYD